VPPDLSKLVPLLHEAAGLALLDAKGARDKLDAAKKGAPSEAAAGLKAASQLVEAIATGRDPRAMIIELAKLDKLGAGPIEAAVKEDAGAYRSLLQGIANVPAMILGRADADATKPFDALGRLAEAEPVKLVRESIVDGLVPALRYFDHQNYSGASGAARDALAGRAFRSPLLAPYRDSLDALREISSLVDAKATAESPFTPIDAYEEYIKKNTDKLPLFLQRFHKVDGSSKELDTEGRWQTKESSLVAPVAPARWYEKLGVEEAFDRFASIRLGAPNDVAQVRIQLHRLAHGAIFYGDARVKHGLLATPPDGGEPHLYAYLPAFPNALHRLLRDIDTDKAVVELDDLILSAADRRIRVRVNKKNDKPLQPVERDELVRFYAVNVVVDSVTVQYRRVPEKK
jgi:hypothetical protein